MSDMESDMRHVQAEAVRLTEEAKAARRLVWERAAFWNDRGHSFAAIGRVLDKRRENVSALTLAWRREHGPKN